MGLVTPDFGLVFWMVLSFLIVLFILKKFAWKPILSALKEREDSIQGALESAENAKKEMSKLKADNEQIIHQAKIERDRLLQEAREVKGKIISEAKTQATKDADKIIAQAKISIQNEKDSALSDIKNKVATLSVEIAQKILKVELSKETKQKEIIEEFLKEAKFN